MKTITVNIQDDMYKALLEEKKFVCQFVDSFTARPSAFALIMKKIVEGVEKGQKEVLLGLHEHE